MRIPRVHVPHGLRAGFEVDLPMQAGEHLVRVLRLERGHPLRLFDGQGREFAGEIATLLPQVARLEPGSPLYVAWEVALDGTSLPSAAELTAQAEEFCNRKEGGRYGK